MIGDEKVSPDYYEVYVNYDKNWTLEEQRKDGSTKDRFTGMADYAGGKFLMVDGAPEGGRPLLGRSGFLF